MLKHFVPFVLYLLLFGGLFFTIKDYSERILEATNKPQYYNEVITEYTNEFGERMTDTQVDQTTARWDEELCQKDSIEVSIRLQEILKDSNSTLLNYKITPIKDVPRRIKH
jgi:hypothetical protein